MSGNTLGRLFRLTTFGESHGLGLGGVVDGCPAGIELTEEDIQREVEKRRPGGGHIGSSSRSEMDKVRLFSGIFEGKTTGTPIGFFIENQDHRPRDYSHIKDIFRPGHGDFTYEAKYGIRDYRGGGRSSGRETVSRVVGGAIAQKFLSLRGIKVIAYTRELGGIAAEVIAPQTAEELPFFAPDPSVIDLWKDRIEEVKKEGDSIGGIVEVQAIGVPPGLGEPVFDKLDARLAYAVMGIGAVKAVEIGAGFEVAQLKGSQNNDYLTKEGFLSNNAGGILAGISSGQPIIVRATVKPIPSISLPQKTMNSRGQEVSLQIRGRHDVSAIPRIVPVIKAMVSLTLADMYLLQFGYEREKNPAITNYVKGGLKR